MLKFKIKISDLKNLIWTLYLLKKLYNHSKKVKINFFFNTQLNINNLLICNIINIFIIHPIVNIVINSTIKLNYSD